MEDSSAHAHIDFSRPPVSETVLGFEFSPSPSLGFVNIAGAHKLWQQDYPELEEHPALAPSIPSGQGPFPMIQFGTGHPGVRLWSKTADQSEVLQLQQDRLILNWRNLGDPENVNYPGFDHLYDRYVEMITRLNEWLGGSIAPLVVEWSYVNTIHAGDLVAQDLFRTWSDPELEIGSGESYTSFRHNRSFAVDDARGQLELSAEPMMDPNVAGALGVILLTVTCKVFVPPATDVTSALAYCREAHRVARQAFVETTTEQAHDMWGGTRA